MKQGAQIQGVPTPLLWTGKANAIRDGIDTVSSAFALRSSAIGTPVTGAALTEPGSTSRFSLASCNVNLAVTKTLSEDVGPAAGFSLLSSFVRTPVSNSVVEDSPGAAAFSLASVLQRSAVSRTVAEDSPGAAAFSLLSCNMGLSALNTDWLARITAAGGVTSPTTTEYSANDAFYAALVSAGLDTKLKFFQGFAGSSLIAALTPLIKGPTANSWVNGGSNLVSGDVGTHGITGNGSTKYADSQANPGAIWSGTNNVGLHFYVFNPNSATGGIECGCFEATSLACILLYSHAFTTAFAGGCWNAGGTDGPSSPSPNVGGFYSMSRVGANDVRSYFANSTNPIAQQSLNAGAVSAAIFSNRNLYALACGAASSSPFAYVNNTMGAIMATDGLNLADTTALYNAVQAYCTTLSRQV